MSDAGGQEGRPSGSWSALADPNKVGRPMLGNLTLLGSTRVLVIAVQFVAFARMAGYLGPVGLGVYTFALGLTALLKPFGNFGFREIATRDVAQERIDERVIVPNLLYWRLVAGAVGYGVLIAIVAVGPFSQPEQRAAVIAGLLLVTGALETMQASLEVRLRMGWVSIANIVEAFAFAAGVLMLAHLHRGIDDFVWLYVGVNTLYMVVIAAVASAKVRYDWSLRPRSCAPLVKAAVPLGLASLFIGLYYRLDITILAWVHSANAVGQYGVGYRFLEAVSILPALFVSVYGPVLARSVRGRPGALQRRYEVGLHLVLLGAVLVGVVGAMTAWRALPRLPGFSSYHGAGVALAILSPAAGLIFVGTVLSAVIVNGHLQRRLLVISGMTLAINLLLNLALIPPFSYVGASVATTLSELTVVAASVWVIRTQLGLHLSRRHLTEAAALGAVLAVALLPGYLLNPFVQMAIGTLVFVTAAVLSRAVTWADVASVLSDAERGRVVVTAGVDADAPSVSAAANWASPMDQLVFVGDPADHGRPTASSLALRTVSGDLRELRRALRGAGRCAVVADRTPAAFRACLAARMAACREVLLVIDGDHWQGWRHPLVTLLVDEVRSA